MKALLALLFSLGALPAAVIYDESLSGDLSGTLTSPTLVIVTLGKSTLIGQTGDNGETGATDGSDADYFYFEVSPGFAVTELTVDLYESTPGNSGRSFMGYRQATGFTAQDGSDLGGFVLFDGGIGNRLPDLAGGPLPAGNHAFWLQETSANAVDYEISFTVIPEPSSLTLALLGALIVRRRRLPR